LKAFPRPASRRGPWKPGGALSTRREVSGRGGGKEGVAPRGFVRPGKASAGRRGRPRRRIPFGGNFPRPVRPRASDPPSGARRTPRSSDPQGLSKAVRPRPGELTRPSIFGGEFPAAFLPLPRI
jgi:hypothetical protein